ncbi:trypsin-like peptidase domain-containing protein (plasmid) [Streptomyces clavuligerus]|nr:trypsin-like peptidase domain-containing protein [Streptomyces clavuligerus]WDN57435.1 trypsin-like peptidase domain-containing protein [Streptomyces clavuligerus]
MPKTSAPAIRRLRGRATGLAVAGTALALLAPLPASAAPAQAPAFPADHVSVLSYTAKERRAALAHWTPARIKAVGKSVDLGPTGPKTKPWRGTPLKTVGRLFFVNANGADTWCSGTAVNSANKSVVMTAAHCVRRGSSPYNTHMDMVFVPGYSKGAQPHGAFAVRAAMTPRSWENDSVNDIAALTLDTGATGRRLTDVVGGHPIAFNRPVGGTITALGYPASNPQLGEELLHCTGTAKKEHGLQAIPCDMTGGSSGGPWFAGLDPATGTGTLVSVNSAGDAFQATKMYGELLKTMAKKVYDRAQRA